MTYGQIAALLGSPRAARIVGGALHALPDGSAVPWHRVVNRQGRISSRCPQHSMDLQGALLREEGVAFLPDKRIDLERYCWWPPEPAERSPGR